MCIPDSMRTTILSFISNKQKVMEKEVQRVDKDPQGCSERTRAKISDFWPHQSSSLFLHRLRTVTFLSKSGSVTALYILVTRKTFSVAVVLFCWRAPKLHTVEKPHISLEVNDIDIFCLVWRCFIHSYSKCDLVLFSISLIILTLAEASVMPEKQCEEENLILIHNTQ